MISKTTKYLYIALLVCIALIVILSVRSCKQGDKIVEQTGLLSSLNDSVKVWKDKDGLNHSKTEAIVTKNPDDFINLPNLSEENKKLQEQVKKYKNQIKNGGSVTNFTSDTKATITVPTKVDSVYYPKDGLISAKPVYKSDFDLGGWVKGSTEARPDSTKIDLSLKNEYTVVIGEDKTGFLGTGKAKPFVEVTNLNPYSVTPTVKTYSVDQKQSKGAFWKYTTVILTVVAGTLIITK